MTNQTFNSAAKAFRYLQKAKNEWFDFYETLDEKTVYKSIMFLLKEAVHFSLPDDGRILDDGLIGLKNVKARLPYPVITIEFNAVYDEGNVKALVLAAEGNAVGFHIELDNPEDCFVTFLMFSIPEVGPMWFISPVMFKITHDWEPSNNDATFNALIFTVLPTVAKAKLKEDKTAQEKFENVSAWAATSVLELCEALTCSNVEIGTLQEASPKNNKRILKGKLPLLEIKTLVINTHRQAKDGEGHKLVGDKRSPRQHLRRGHIRFLKSDRYKNKQGQKIWVNSTVVGSHGKIDKTYEIR